MGSVSFCLSKSDRERNTGLYAMNEQLLLENIRSVLVRLEETIIFALIERAQFHVNEVVYRAGFLAAETGADSLLGFMLHETERVHARMRRYTSPDEEPFYPDLPEPVLPRLSFAENPLHANDINVNNRIRDMYVHELVPMLCPDGDDSQYGSTVVCDVACLQALSKRIHYGKFVAESKFRDDEMLFRELCTEADRDGIVGAITNEAVEDCVLARVERKAGGHIREITSTGAADVFAAKVVRAFREWIIPMTKDVEVEYLLGRMEE